MYRVLLATILVFWTAFVAEAAEGDWQVSKASHQVNYTVDKTTWTPVKAGDTIPNNAWISTGARGRAQIVRGVESITFQPNTVAGLFTKSGFFERTTDIYQQVGTIELEIEKRNRPHTTVETPFLAAVVKGTTFRVEVTKRSADVVVNHGLVQVTSFNSGQRANVGPGQSAAVDAARGMTVSGSKGAPSISSVAPSVSRVPAIGSLKSPNSKPEASARSSSPSKSNGVTGGEKGGTKNGSAASGNVGNSGKGNNGNGNGGASGTGNNGNGNGNSGGSGQGNGQGNNGQGNGNGGSSGQSNSGNGNGNSGGSGQGNGQGNNGQGNGNGGSSGNNSSGNGNGNGNGNGG